MQNNEVNVLNDIFQAASMGTQSLELLINKTDNTQFKQKLVDYLYRYNEFKSNIQSTLAGQNEKPKDVKKIDSASLWVGVQMNTLADKTSSNMAEMLIKGGTAAIIEIVRLKNLNPNMSQENHTLLNSFLYLQNQLIEDMKQYL